jgi:hypothetical protein
MKFKVWVFMDNLGDGSCAARFFKSKEAATKYAEQNDYNGERFSDDIYSHIFEFDENGDLLNGEDDERPDDQFIIKH